MELILVTGNKEKLRVARASLKDFGLTIVGIDLETPEIQSKSSKEIAAYSAKFAANVLGKPVLKTDASWHIKALNGFPGPFVKYVNDWLSPEGYLKLMEGVENREVEVIEYLAYCEPNLEPVLFVGKANGTISKKAIGVKGSVLDKIFIPSGEKTTASKLGEIKMAKFWSKNLIHWQEFKEYLKKTSKL